jgi:hypothetical protein
MGNHANALGIAENLYRDALVGGVDHAVKVSEAICRRSIESSTGGGGQVCCGQSKGADQVGPRGCRDRRPSILVETK